ncbi:MAG: hypothetical protein ACFFCS_07775 [Candidatus Hodarchaeota archaeon]
MGFKDYLKRLKINNCFKGAILVFFAMLNNRAGVGVGRLDWNFTFGTLAFIAIVASGMFTSKFYKEKGKIIAEGRKKSAITQFMVALGIGFGIGLALGAGIYHYIFTNDYIVILTILLLAFGIFVGNYFLTRKIFQISYTSFGSWLGIGVALAAWNGMICDTLPITLGFSISIGVIWIIIAMYGERVIENGAIKNLLDTLPVSAGLIYGAAINGVIISLPIYLFFIALSSLLVSREIIKDSMVAVNMRKKDEFTMPGTIGMKKSLNAARFLQGITIIGLTIAIFSGLINNALYSYPLLVVLILGIYVLVMLRDAANATKRKLNGLRRNQRWAVFLTYLAIIFAAI